MDIRDAIWKRLPSHLPEALREMGRLASARGDRLYLVGGGVRDLLLERPASIREVDLVIVGDAARLVREAEAAGVARRVTHSQFLTYKLDIAGRPEVDLVTARRETYAQPGALPQVEPAGLEEDLWRRDFAINALAASLGPDDFGQVADPTGGFSDLHAGLIRALHERSFQDDATRIFRAARYAARFGFDLETRTKGWLGRDVRYIETISADRLRHECDRIWQEPGPEATLALLQAWGALAQVHSGLRWTESLADAFARARAERPSDVSLAPVCLALLAGRMAPATASGLVARLNLPQAEARAVRDALKLRADVEAAALEPLKPSKVVERLEAYDAAAVLALVLDGPAHSAGLLAQYLREWRHVRPMLTGDQLLALGVPQGPLVGRLLARLQEARLDGLVSSEAEEWALVKRWLP